MAAEVSRQMKSDGKSGLITRDFLGGCSSGGGGGGGSTNVVESSKELDLDLHVPVGWEKRLDLKYGKVYLQRCNPASANTSSDQTNFADKLSTRLQDLNSLQRNSSTIAKPTLNLLEQPSLDLKLVSNCSPSNYTSVCTLDKVKSALDRAERSSPSTSSSSRKRWMMPSVVGSQTKSSPSPSNSSSLSVKGTEEEEEKVSLSPRWPSAGSDQSELLVATACPSCFLYVLISKNDPKCPKCNSVLQLPVMTKKPKIDLNISM